MYTNIPLKYCCPVCNRGSVLNQYLCILGTNSAPELAYLYLNIYESSCMISTEHALARSFHLSLDDLLWVDNYQHGVFATWRKDGGVYPLMFGLTSKSDDIVLVLVDLIFL